MDRESTRGDRDGDRRRLPTPADAGAAAATDVGRHVVVLSPHLDDAALSLGATIARASRSGARVDVVNVFANDPESTAGAGPGTRHAASRAPPRRPGRAARRTGVRASCSGRRLFGFRSRTTNTSRTSTTTASGRPWPDVVGAAETVLMPGFPLAAPDHLRLTRLLLARPLPGVRAGLYVEQPYATWRLIGRGRRTGARASRLRRGCGTSSRSRSGRVQADACRHPRIPPVLSNGWTPSPGSRFRCRRGTGGSSSERFAPTSHRWTALGRSSSRGWSPTRSDGAGRPSHGFPPRESAGRAWRAAGCLVSLTSCHCGHSVSCDATDDRP